MSAFNYSLNNTISLKDEDEEAGDSGIWSQTLSNITNHVNILMDPEWLNGRPYSSLSIWMTTIAPDGSQNQTFGPVLRLIKSPTSPGTPSTMSSAPASNTPMSSAAPGSHKSSNKVGMEAGIPIGLVFLLALLAGLFFILRRHRRGYVGTRARGVGAVQLTGDEFRATRSRGNSFKDEPAQSVELQQRNSHRSQYSVGESSVSPISDTGRSSNAFRDEIARQRAGDHGSL